ncbi:cbb3-type cytochrome oxidase assembly protein CcoS [Photobacterium lutimaris]|uniref:Cbb3-type cytochrome oxidase assembly protein CcoS n=1 Tax=Photobacterium lutimaris TaxID=388278 RepID=A0A2T3J0T6_9GAMM|nr:cbb3-type cytochrome oxidase assembly protein CcoS [Photobacterium lutimaris]PSU34688.1 cbb3-type cytochrome oxidase assembly protein CcoS [Photobacterium lutimaris]TDR77005.1 cbb3-type cytochrome oxidase maturation protein [Photobacterium lutimaris]
MASLYLLIPIAIIFVCIAVGIFLWAVRSEQFEDLERQGYDILFDEDESKPTESKAKATSTEVRDRHGDR